jgi:hypothetical protein
MVPKSGPLRFVVPGVAVAIPGGGAVGPITFRFPRALFVTSLLLLARSGARGDAASLRLRVQDESFADVIADGFGTSFSAPALSLSGLTVLDPMFADLVVVRPFVLQRPVADGDTWRFTITNTFGAPITPELLIGFDEGLRP